MRGFVAGLKVVLLAVVSAVAYGVLHDLVTAHVCLEYFTVAHPRLFATDVAAAHALAWGVIATWWVGALLGAPLAVASLAGRNPKLNWRDLRRPIATLLIVSGVSAILAGVVGFVLARMDLLQLAPMWAEQIPEERHDRFFICGAAHTASYTVGAAGGLMLIMWAWKERQVRKWRAAADAHTSSERTSSA